MRFNDYFLIFAFSVLMFQICSYLAIELCEKPKKTKSPIYLGSICGVYSSIYTGAESLYQMVKIKEREASHGRKSNCYYIES